MLQVQGLKAGQMHLLSSRPYHTCGIIRYRSRIAADWPHKRAKYGAAKQIPTALVHVDKPATTFSIALNGGVLQLHYEVFLVTGEEL